MRSFEPNVISFTVTSGRKIWYIVGAYVPPNDLLAVHPVTYALEYGTEGMGKMLVGDLNACLVNPRYQRDNHLATVITGNGLTYQERHLIPRWRYRAEENWTWIIWGKGKPILGQRDYISRTSQHNLYNTKSR